MNRSCLAAATALVTLASTPGWAQDGAALAAKFGALESIQQISLSPDGNKVAFVVPSGDGGAILKVADLAAGGAPKGILAQRNPGETLRGCQWATDARIVCRISTIVNFGGYLIPFTRLIAVGSDGSNPVQLTGGAKSSSLDIVTFGGAVIDWDLPEKPGKILVMRQYVPDEGSRIGVSRDESGIGVEEVDVNTLARRTVERPKPDATEYISDGEGVVRVLGTQPRNAQGYVGNKRFYYYRKPGAREWTDLSQVVNDPTFSKTTGFDPFAVDGKANIAFGFDDNGGYKALYSVTLGEQLPAKQLVLSRPDVDVDQLIQIGRDGRVVGASYATERRATEFFDPELKKLGAALRKALPGQPNVDFVDASANEDKLLLFASSDVDPGMFYRFDKTAKQLSPILPVRAQLAGVKMGEMKPVTFPAADGTQIPAYLTLPPGSTGKNLPAIVMPHGGPGARDEWGFDWLVQYFATRGYAVIQPNFRGSAGYGSAWFQKNGFQSWRTAIGDVNDAGRWLTAQGIAAPGKLGIVGWSYGGYAALQSAVLDPALFKGIVAIAPVTDLSRLRDDALNSSGYKLTDRFIGSGAHVKEGSPAQNAEKFVAPVLMFHGDKDLNVPLAQAELMADRLRGSGKQVELVKFPGLDHQLASAAARTRMLSDSDVFLRKALGIAP